MQNAVPAVRALSGETEFQPVAVKLSTPRDQILYRRRPLFHQRVDCCPVAETIPRIQRVLLMQCNFVIVTQGHRNAALRVL